MKERIDLIGLKILYAPAFSSGSYCLIFIMQFSYRNRFPFDQKQCIIFLDNKSTTMGPYFFCVKLLWQ